MKDFVFFLDLNLKTNNEILIKNLKFENFNIFL